VKVARELGLPFGSVFVKAPREALVEVAQSAALGVMGGALSMILWEGVPGVASLGKSLGVVPREVGFATEGSIGAELWLIKEEPITLVESTVRLDSIGEVWPPSILVVIGLPSWLTLRSACTSRGAEDE
jgi:hypothetical protein